MTVSSMAGLARCAYEEYGAHQDWKNFRGDPMPQWDDLPEGIRAAWEASTRAVAKAICLATLAPLRELIEEIRSSAEEA